MSHTEDDDVVNLEKEKVEDNEDSLDSDEIKKILSKKYKRPVFACQYCKNTFSSRQTRDYHVGVAQCFGKLYTCKRCMKPFAAPWRLDRHQHQRVRCKEQDQVIVIRNGKRYTTYAYDGNIEKSEEDDAEDEGIEDEVIEDEVIDEEDNND